MFLPYQFLFQRCSPSPSSSVTTLCINAYPPPYTLKLLITCVIESPNRIIFGQLSADMLTVGKRHWRIETEAVQLVAYDEEGLHARLSRENILFTFGFDCYVPSISLFTQFRSSDRHYFIYKNSMVLYVHKNRMAYYKGRGQNGIENESPGPPACSHNPEL